MAFTLGREAAGDGSFRRQDSAFRERPEHLEAGRYHLYVAFACPWAHRTLIVRALKGLEGAIGVSYVDPFRDERGWAFTGGEHSDAVNGWSYLAEAYPADFEGRVSVPVLWDLHERRIVNNESADIVELLDAWGSEGPDLLPDDLRGEVERVNELVYENVNNGVYRAGFASSQAAYDEAFAALFHALEQLDELLGSRRYLAGDRLTLADWRLWTTLVRFDPVYHTHFRCNGRRLIDHPNLWPYARELFQMPGVAETVRMDEIKRHYYTTHDELNPKRIIPGGPLGVDWWAPHGRDGT